MKLEVLSLRTSRGATVAALDYEPRSARPVALAAAHGYSSSKHNLDALCAFLSSHGYRVVSLDFPGHKLGASGGRLETVDDLTDAVAAVVGYIRERYACSTYTLGHSMGATTALRACAADPSLSGAISIATGYGRPRALRALESRVSVDLRAAYVDGLTLLDVVAQTEPLLDAALARLAGRPVLYIAATRDGIVSQSSARELFERAPEPKTFATVDSDHTTAAEHARSAVLGWLNERHPR